MSQVKIYTTSVCPYCIRAKNLFKSLNVPFEEVSLERNPGLRQQLSEQHNWRTVPMIFVGDQFLGGFDDVNALHRAGKLTPMLGGAQASAGA